MRTVLILAMLCTMNAGFAIHVHERGYWYGEDKTGEHRFDAALANGLVQFFKEEEAKTIADFGCGPGKYLQLLKLHQFACDGFDGNPDTVAFTNGLGQVADLTAPLHLNQIYDWVLCLEVGEHIPKQFEQIFLNNIDKYNAKGVVLSWALKGQGGFGHFNEQNNDYVKRAMAARGYKNDLAAEERLRAAASLSWFKNTIMVFRK